MQIENLITEHIDTWTSAVKKKSATGRGSNKKIELYGIKKLRELILELAVRGKLVPQDANDEPANNSLIKSLEVKDTWITDGRLKKSRSKKIINDEHFYSYPDSWETAKLEDLIHVINGRAYKKAEMLQSGIPLLRVGNLFTSNDWYYSDLELEPNKYIDNGDLIYAWSASFGPFIWGGKKVIYHYHIWKMDIFNAESLDKNFSRLYLQAISERIKASGNGIAMIHMTKERMEKVIHPLPPIAEQHRIVAKVDELMLLCDQLEQHTESSIDAHKTLVEVLLNTLTNSKDTIELQTNWARVSEFFDTLFTTEHSIDQLKQTILQLAVMGKLVPQDPNDEHASELLKRIATEKAQLIADKKIKKQKELPAITDDEKLFELPNGWEWCRLGKIINLISGQHLKPNEYSNDKILNGIPYITGPAEFGVLHPTYSKYTMEKRAIAVEGDILITCKGAGLGKLNQANENIAISRQLMAIQPILAHTSYLYALIDSKYKYFQERGVGIAIPGMSREDVTDLVLMAPPLEEQVRIFDKIKKLTIICDQLKSQLNQAQQTQLQFTDSITGKITDNTLNKIEVSEKKETMKITTILETTTEFNSQSDAVLAKIVTELDEKADAKNVWSKSKLDLPAFYKQLKKEIKLGYISEPAQAIFE